MHFGQQLCALVAHASFNTQRSARAARQRKASTLQKLAPLAVSLFCHCAPGLTRTPFTNIRSRTVHEHRSRTTSRTPFTTRSRTAVHEHCSRTLHEHRSRTVHEHRSVHEPFTNTVHRSRTPFSEKATFVAQPRLGRGHWPRPGRIRKPSIPKETAKEVT